MRANLYEKLLLLMVEHKDDHDTLKNLIAKGEVLISRKGDNREASVVRELTNL